MASIVILACAVFSVFSGAVAQNTYSPDTQNIYHLFTRENPTISQTMLLGFPTLIGSNFNIQRRTSVIIHGWNSGPTSSFNIAMVPAILAAIDVNLILVDWSAGAMVNDYDVVVNNNVPLGAESIARFITWLNLETGATVTQYHIVGFEVGAHMAGLVGRSLNGLVPIVTALNPPGISQGWNASNSFAPTDGLATEAIHTDVYGSGTLQPVADVDFYPNGGLTQPGCNPSGAGWECNRDRAYLLYAESIVSGGFTGSKCETTQEVLIGNCDATDTLAMGGLIYKAGYSGLYYVSTNAVPPYSIG